MRAVRGTNWNAKDSEKLRQKALDLCESARGQLILRHPFVGRLGVHIPFLPVMDSRVRTIATNGKVIYVRPEWLCRMPPVTLVALIAHTIWTAALCHSFRRGETDPVLFDAASDLETYTLLRVEKVPMCLKPDFADRFPKHLPVEEIAKQLTQGCERHPDSDVHLYTAGIISLPPLPVKEEKKEKACKNLPEGTESVKRGQPQDGQKEEGASQGTDGQEQPQDGQKEEGASQRPNGQGQPQDGQKEEGASQRTDGQGQPQDGQKEEGASQRPNGQGQPQDGDIDGEVDTSCDPAMKEVWRQRIIEAGQHYKMVFGALPGELEELVQSFQESKIDYLQLLRKYLGMASGGEAHWLPPARRFVWQGMYLPSHQNPKIEIVVAVDTSGSIDEEQFQVVFSEIAGIVKELHNYELTLIQCDAKIHSVQMFSAAHPYRENEPVKIAGRGGTDFRPVFEYVKNRKLNPKVLLYYTDGMGDFPVKPPHYPVIWLLQDGEPEMIPWGKVIEVPKEEKS